MIQVFAQAGQLNNRVLFYREPSAAKMCAPGLHGVEKLDALCVRSVSTESINFALVDDCRVHLYNCLAAISCSYRN